MSIRNRCLRTLPWLLAAACALWVCAHLRSPHPAQPAPSEATKTTVGVVELARESLPNHQATTRLVDQTDRPDPTAVAQTPSEPPAGRPTEEQLLGRVRALIHAEGPTIRRELILLFDELLVTKEGHGSELAQTFVGRWALPEAFASELLEAILPLLDQVHLCDPPDDDMKFLLMALEILERMRHAPALPALLREDGVPALGEMTPWTWPRFGVAAVEPLADRVRKGSDRARAQALVALREVRDPAAVPTLTHIVEKDPNADLRAAAAQALRGIGLATDMDRFRRVAASPSASFVERREAVLALAAHGTAADLDFLLRRVQWVLATPYPRPDEAVDVAAETLHALVERGDAKAIDWVLRLVQNRGLDTQANDEVRNHAIEDLGLFAVRSAEPVLVLVMNDEHDDLRTRWWAASALTRIRPTEERAYAARARELDERWQVLARQGGTER